MAGAVAELPQLSDSDLEEEEGDDRDRLNPYMMRNNKFDNCTASSVSYQPLFESL